jgi:predicted ester cyclase
MSRENIESSRRILDEGFSGGNLDVIDEICSDDFVGHDPIAGDQDREAGKQSMAAYREAFPDLQFTAEDIFAAGDKVVIRWTANGTFENDLFGQKATGEKGDPTEGITIDRYEDGKLVESWTQWDTLGFMREIGAIPAGTEAAASS